MSSVWGPDPFGVSNLGAEGDESLSIVLSSPVGVRETRAAMLKDATGSNIFNASTVLVDPLGQVQGINPNNRYLGFGAFEETSGDPFAHGSAMIQNLGIGQKIETPKKAEWGALVVATIVGIALTYYLGTKL
jgi:hypothetical protein